MSTSSTSSTSSFVDFEEYKCASRGDLHTDALLTCTRVAVVGSYSNGSHGNDRFLAHLSESFDPINGENTLLDQFIDKIKHAKRNGLVIEEAVVLTADDNDEDLDDFNRDVISVLQQGIGVSAKVASHSADVKYEMRIRADKGIWFRREADGSDEEGGNWETYSE